MLDLLTPKLVAGAIVLALLSGALWVQTQRLNAARETIAARDARIDLLGHAISDRDTAIARQNAAINEIRRKQEADKAAYRDRLLKAETRAEKYRAEAQDLLEAKTDAPDELERCRATLRLIITTVAKD